MHDRPFILRVTLVALGVALLLLQVRLWVSEDGLREMRRLQRDIDFQRGENEQLADRNRRLGAEVRDLKRGVSALEERARSDLGLVAPNETFYVIGSGPQAGDGER